MRAQSMDAKRALERYLHVRCSAILSNELGDGFTKKGNTHHLRTPPDRWLHSNPNGPVSNNGQCACLDTGVTD